MPGSHGEDAAWAIARRRLVNQRLVGSSIQDPAEVVHWLGAVQSQDFLGARWALAQRTASGDAAMIDRAFDAGRILRTHVLRPTWHLVAPEDIRWLLALSGPRVNAANAGRYRELELDAATLRRGDAAIAGAIGGGRTLTRPELASVLGAAGLEPRGQRLAYLVMHAELEGLICSGPLRGRQHTYALLDGRAGPGRMLDRDEALGELVRRYFTSHGPATVRDFAWWSGLTVADARRGLDVAGSRIEPTTLGAITYWEGDGGTATVLPEGPVVHLLPNFDEHVVAYRDHELSVRADAREAFVGRADLVFGAHPIAIDGQVVGGWRRSLGPHRAVVTPKPAVALTTAERSALLEAAKRFETFLGRPVDIEEGP